MNQVWVSTSLASFFTAYFLGGVARACLVGLAHLASEDVKARKEAVVKEILSEMIVCPKASLHAKDERIRWVVE